MSKPKCLYCENRLDVDYYERGGVFACIFSSRVETGRVAG